MKRSAASTMKAVRSVGGERQDQPQRHVFLEHAQGMEAELEQDERDERIPAP